MDRENVWFMGEMNTRKLLKLRIQMAHRMRSREMSIRYLYIKPHPSSKQPKIFDLLIIGISKKLVKMEYR